MEEVSSWAGVEIGPKDAFEVVPNRSLGSLPMPFHKTLLMRNVGYAVE